MKEVHDHSFNVNAATAIGHEKAILLKELYYWCQQNFNNQRNFHHGLYWTYNTAEAFVLKFPYFSRRSIARWLQQMEQDGYIGSLLLNKKGYDRTKWYCVNEEAYVALCEGSKPGSLDYFKKYITNLANSIGQNGQTNGQDGQSTGQNGQPIPPLNLSPNPSIKPTTFVEKEFSTVTLIDEVDETSVEIHHVPEYFEVKDQLKGLSEKDKKLTYEIMKDTPGFFDTETKKERKSSAKKKETTAEEMDLVFQVVQYLNEKTEQAFQPGGEKTKSLILARHHADKWTLEDFKTVIDHKKSEWSPKDNLRQYLRPSTLFAAGHAEEYLQAAKLWKKKPVAMSPGVVPLFRQENYNNVDKSKFKF